MSYFHVFFSCLVMFSCFISCTVTLIKYVTPYSCIRTICTLRLTGNSKRKRQDVQFKPFERRTATSFAVLPNTGNICGNIEILLEYYSWVVVKYSEQRAIAGTYSREISRLLRKYRISTGLWCSGNSSLSIAVFESKKVLYCFQNQSRFRFWFRNS